MLIPLQASLTWIRAWQLKHIKPTWHRLFSCESDSRIANVRSSVCLSVSHKKPLRLSELLLFTIEPIDLLSLSTYWAYQPLSLLTIELINHWAYWPSSLLTIKPIDLQAYRPSSLSTIKPIDHQAHWPLGCSIVRIQHLQGKTWFHS